MSTFSNLQWWMYHAILDAETQLVFRIGPFDFYLNDRRARYHSELHDSLVFGVLDVGLAGGKWKPHEADAVDRYNLVAYV